MSSIIDNLGYYLSVGVLGLGLLLGRPNLSAQTLAGTDGLGRILPLNKEVGDPQENAHVAMFYFLWQGDAGSPTSPEYWNLTDIVKEHPEVLHDFDNANWGGGVGSYYFWGEPIYGYYNGCDYWVHLKNMQLLTDAGIDMVVLDATNRLTYIPQVCVLQKAADAIRKQGRKAPKIVFYTNTMSGDAMQEIYDTFYKEGAPYRNEDCWFYLDGKPLIIGVSAEANGRNYASFFTIRESQWPTVEKKENGWPWIEFVRPQPVYENSRGEKEIINVSVCQHPDAVAGMGGAAFYGNPNNWGRSYRNGSHGNPETDIKYGYNFQEQWNVALKERPPFVYVTGWNEWIAGRWKSPDGDPEKSYFCDQASPEYSRDIEPTRTAGLDDHYYMQLVGNVRRYKGVAKNEPLGAMKTIKSLSDWADVTPVFADYTGDAVLRYARGAQAAEYYYVNNTGRNDFDKMKVARDYKNLYFYASMARNIILSEEDDDWVALYIDADRSHDTGWNGFDYRVIRGKFLQKYDNSWNTVAKIRCTMENNEMMFSIPLAALGMSPDNLNFEFKWTENCFVQGEMDPMLWYVNGDTAPGARFTYLVVSE